MVLTIRNAGTSTSAITGAAPEVSRRPAGYAKIVAATTPAAAGLGMPAKYRLSPEPAWMLKRARRIAAAVTKMKPAAQPQRPKDVRPHWYARMAGARPNE